ncbi:MAG: oligosaccharide flippase family protein [Actinobacteria bacterium]|nr:oligosaccharide flippase family protein [Actinomycetota bacterium]
METVHRVLKSHPGFLHVAIGQAGAVALGAVFWFVMARLLEPGDYGQVNWLLSIAMFASTCCVLGWGKTVVTYYPKEGRDELLGGVVAIVLVASLAIGIAMGLLVEPLVGLLIVGLSLFSMTIYSELGRRRYRRYKWVMIGAKLIALPLAMGMYFWLGLLGVLLGYAIPYLLFGLLSLRYVRRGNPSIMEAKGKAGFALRAFGADITTGSTSLLDKILIGSVFGMAALGLYQLAYQIFAALSVLPMILFSYLLPEKSAGAKTKEVETLGILVSVALAVSVVVLSPIVIPWVFPNFAGSVGLIQIMSLGVVPFTIAATKMSGLYAHEKPGAVLVSYVAALVVGIAGIMTLGKFFGAIGLAASMLLLQTTLAASLCIHSSRFT